MLVRWLLSNATFALNRGNSTFVILWEEISKIMQLFAVWLNINCNWSGASYHYKGLTFSLHSVFSSKLEEGGGCYLLVLDVKIKNFWLRSIFLVQPEQRYLESHKEMVAEVQSFVQILRIRPKKGIFEVPVETTFDTTVSV